MSPSARVQRAGPWLVALVAIVAGLLPAAPAAARRATHHHRATRPHAHAHARHRRPVGRNPRGRMLGVIPSRRARRHHRAVARAAADLPLEYWGGAVMATNTTYAIYWQPPGYSFPAGYQTTIDGFLASVAADSGSDGNVYALDAQYSGDNGAATYRSTFAGSTVASDALPSNGCPLVSGVTACVNDGQLVSEIDSVVSGQGLPVGLGHLYFIFTPPNLGSCYDNSTSDCAYTSYCAYHSWASVGGGELIYANQPYAAVSGCDSGERPNGNAADATINVASHEHNEAITDPDGAGWYDANGEEIGDKCAWDFGTALGSTGGAGTDYNQAIGSGFYELQQEWDNESMSCRLDTPTAGFTGPSGPVATGDQATFDGSATSAPAGTTVTSYAWTFGDGTSASGAIVNHAWTRAGSYVVQLTVTDSDGGVDRLTKSVTVTDRPPTAAFGVASGATAGQPVAFDGGASTDPDGSVVRWSWDFGDGSGASGARPVHGYDSPGTYVVTLRVTDDSGSVSAPVSQLVSVAPAPPPVAPAAAPGRPAVTVAATGRLSAVLASGLPIGTACRSTCTLSVEVRLDRRDARRLHLRGTPVVATASAVSPAAPAQVRVPLRGGVRRALARARSVRVQVLVRLVQRGRRAQSYRRTVRLSA